jgi:hypothetical protein
MKNRLVLCFLLVFTLSHNAQGQMSKSFRLSDKLKEISGLECIGDSLLIAHNDGGNEPILYVLDLFGSILKECRVFNAKNTDWEDITKDNFGNLYIADIGNNENKRKKIRVLKLSIIDVLTKDSVSAETHPFSYLEQTEYPALPENRYFDAESILYFKDSLWIFTKCRTFPFDGKSYVYTIKPENLNSGNWKKRQEFIPGTKSWKTDSFTAATSDKEQILCLTYNRLIWLTTGENGLIINKTKHFIKYNQRESVAVSSTGMIYIANEGNWLLGKQRLRWYKNE